MNTNLVENETPVIAKSWGEFQKIRQLVFNRFSVDIGAYTITGKDTEFEYQLTVSNLKKSLKPVVISYIQGIQDCFNSF